MTTSLALVRRATYDEPAYPRLGLAKRKNRSALRCPIEPGPSQLLWRFRLGSCAVLQALRHLEPNWSTASSAPVDRVVYGHFLQRESDSTRSLRLSKLAHRPIAKSPSSRLTETVHVEKTVVGARADELSLRHKARQSQWRPAEDSVENSYQVHEFNPTCVRTRSLRFRGEILTGLNP